MVYAHFQIFRQNMTDENAHTLVAVMQMAVIAGWATWSSYYRLERCLYGDNL